MQGILLHLNEKIMLDDIAEKERKERDEKMKEEGRIEERTKHFLDMGEIEDVLVDGHQHRAFLSVEVSRGGGASSSSKRGSHHEQQSRSTQDIAAELLADRPVRRPLTPHAMVLNTVDSEVRVAEDLFKQMKQLRGDLKKRMAHIDDIAEGRSRVIGGVASDRVQGLRVHGGLLHGDSYTMQPAGRWSSSPSVNARANISAYDPDDEYNREDEYDEEIRVDLKHSSIAAAAKAIQSDLNVTLNALNTRLAVEHEVVKSTVSSSVASATESVINKLASVSGGGGKLVEHSDNHSVTFHPSITGAEKTVENNEIHPLGSIASAANDISQVVVSENHKIEHHSVALSGRAPESLKKEIDAVLGRESIDVV